MITTSAWIIPREPAAKMAPKRISAPRRTSPILMNSSVLAAVLKAVTRRILLMNNPMKRAQRTVANPHFREIVICSPRTKASVARKNMTTKPNAYFFRSTFITAQAMEVRINIPTSVPSKMGITWS